MSSDEGDDREVAEIGSDADAFEAAGFDDGSQEIDNGDGAEVKHTGQKRKRDAAKELAPEKLAAYAAAEKRKGLVYLGRIPPGMKPIKVRHLLSRYGDIGRIYLAPEDPVAYRKRVKAGGNKKLRFTEGWVEFADKSVAKAVAEMLNNTAISEGKRGFYSADLWNIKFLPHFKWHHLTEKLTYERRIRRDKLRAELTEARKDAEAYVDKAEAARKIRKMEDRKLAASAGGDGSSSSAAVDPSVAAAAVEKERSKIRRQFTQHKPLPDPTLQALGMAKAEAGKPGKK